MAREYDPLRDKQYVEPFGTLKAYAGPTAALAAAGTVGYIGASAAGGVPKAANDIATSVNNDLSRMTGKRYRVAKKADNKVRGAHTFASKKKGIRGKLMNATADIYDDAKSFSTSRRLGRKKTYRTGELVRAEASVLKTKRSQLNLGTNNFKARNSKIAEGIKGAGALAAIGAVTITGFALKDRLEKAKQNKEYRKFRRYE